jgi:hypothetical protein
MSSCAPGGRLNRRARLAFHRPCGMTRGKRGECSTTTGLQRLGQRVLPLSYSRLISHFRPFVLSWLPRNAAAVSKGSPAAHDARSRRKPQRKQSLPTPFSLLSAHLHVIFSEFSGCGKSVALVLGRASAAGEAWAKGGRRYQGADYHRYPADLRQMGKRERKAKAPEASQAGTAADA